jgi:hypothetical protein
VKRADDWPRRLHAALEAIPPDEKFAWGKRDCAFFTCDLVAAMTGVDMAAEYRGRYNSQAGAVRVLRQAGGLERIAEKMAHRHELEEVKPAFAQRGDVAMLDTDDGPALGVVALDGRNALFSGPQGLRAVPVLSCRRAWRIP